MLFNPNVADQRGLIIPDRVPDWNFQARVDVWDEASQKVTQEQVYSELMCDEGEQVFGLEECSLYLDIELPGLTTTHVVLEKLEDKPAESQILGKNVFSSSLG